MPSRGLSRLFVLAAFAAAAFAQEGTGVMVGVIADPADAVVPHATVTATDTATGLIRSATSDEAGRFRFNDMRPGRYSIRAEAAGFKALDLTNIQLLSSETRDLGKLVLQIGAVSEEVMVTAASTPVQTASSERSASVTTDQLEDFSLKGRDPFALMQTLPGVVDGNINGRDLESAYSMGSISINGASPTTINVAVDGVSEMDEGGNYTAFVTPNLESIAEMRVLTNGYQAEYGRQAGGTINVITKSGGKDFHGTGHFDHRHEDLTANTFFNNRQGIQRPLYRYMIAGYSFGGPVFIPHKVNRDRNKLFFFVSQEFTQIAQPTKTVQTNEPTAAERTGDFSNSRTSAGVVIPIINPTNGSPFPGNKIPSNMIDPTGSAILNLLPLPNGYVNPSPGQQFTANFLASATPPYNRRNDIVRMDASITSKLSMYYRFGQDVDNQTDEFTITPGAGANVRFLPGYIHGVHLTYTATPTMVNEFQFGVGHDNYGFTPQQDMSKYFRSSTLNPPTLRPFPTGPEYFNYLPCASFAGGNQSNPGWYGYSQGGGSASCSLVPYKNFNDNYVAQDDITKIIGAHSLKAGIMYEYNDKVEPSAGSTYMGNFNFGSSTNNPSDTGYGYANALLGVYQTYQEASNRAVPNVFWHEIDFYVQDSWRVSKKLTVDYGVRFIHETAVSEDNHYASDFYPQLWNAKNAPVLYQQGSVGGKSAAVNPLTGVTGPAALIGTIIPGSGSPVDGMNVDGLTGKGDFYFFPALVAAPRLGFAYDPTGSGKMVIRASAGIFYNRTRTSVPGGGTAPVVYTPQLYYGTISGIPAAAANAVISPTAASAIYGHQPIERTHEFNLTVQRDIGFNTVVDVGYVGTFDRHSDLDANGGNSSLTIQQNPLPYHIYANPAALFNNTEIQANLLRTAYPGMGAITYDTFSNSAVNYNGLQTGVTHRLTRGLSFGGSYTFSKALGTTGLDPYNNSHHFYYGPLTQDRKHLFSYNFAYTLPTPASGIKAVKAVLGDWTLSAIGIFTTGAPVSPSCSSTAPFPYSDPTETGATARCQVTGNPQSYSQNFFNNFNTSAFGLATIGTWGNAGYNILRQPSWWNLDTALDKKIAIKERLAIRLRFQAFNVFNHTEFNTIGATYQFNAANANLNTTTGQYTNTNAPRKIALTARVEF